ncbi:MAG: hypothetical protein U0L58_10390 [Ruminococcus sp.]|nr:hypothetical protein [Ruminococcus sp.]
MADVDIGEELLKAVRVDFRKELGNKDSRLAKILKRIQDGKGTMHDAAMFSKECGAALSEAIAKNVTPDKLPDGQLYYNIADTILRSTLKDNYDLVNMAAQAVQEQTDNKLNIHLAPQQAAFPEDRVHKIVNAAADQTADSDTIKRRLDSPVRNVTESFYDDFVEENAGFRDEAGLKTYLVRQTNGKCCDWCAGFAGRYIYEDAPEEVFAKHDNCTCTVEYITDKYRENVHTKKRYALTPEQRQEILKNAPKPTRFTKEQAENLQNNILNGKSAGNNDDRNSESSKLILIGRLDFNDERAIIRSLEECERETVNLPYERCRVITSDGRIWDVHGSSSFVDTSAIETIEGGSSLQGSYSYHNHPREQTHFSFSAEDVADFISNAELLAKASDYKYSYIMRRTAQTIGSSYNDVYREFKNIRDTEVMEKAFSGDLNFDEDGFHETMSILSKRYGFFYERILRENYYG